jgi:FkbM family methyltransferase
MLITMDRLHAEYGVSPKRVLHVGAHLGEEAAAYHAAGVEEVLWVEANADLFGALTDNLRPYPGQVSACAAISDTDGGQAHLHLASFTMSSSLLPPKEHYRFYPHIQYPTTREVTTTTVDTLLRSLGYAPGHFDMANIDIEGAELLAFRGMAETLPNLRWVYLEVNHEEMYAGCALLPDVDAFLEARGFERIAIQDAGYYHGWSDACYARRAA